MWAQTVSYSSSGLRSNSQALLTKFIGCHYSHWQVVYWACKFTSLTLLEAYGVNTEIWYAVYWFWLRVSRFGSPECHNGGFSSSLTYNGPAVHSKIDNSYPDWCCNVDILQFFNGTQREILQRSVKHMSDVVWLTLYCTKPKEILWLLVNKRPNLKILHTDYAQTPST